MQDPTKADNNGGITNWWWQNDDGSYPQDEDVLIDGNQDGIAERYLFNQDGWMYADSRLFSGNLGPDGAALDEHGAVCRIAVPEGVGQGAISWKNKDYLSLLGKTEEQVRAQLDPTKLERAGYSYMENDAYDLFYYFSDRDGELQFSDYMSLCFRDGVLTQITIPLVQLVDGLPVTCSGRELDACLSELGVTAHSEYNAEYFSRRVYWYEVDQYKITRWWSADQNQFSFTEKVHVTNLD